MPALIVAQATGGLIALLIVRTLYPAVTPDDAATVLVPHGDGVADDHVAGRSDKRIGHNVSHTAMALHVDDVAAARAVLAERGVQFQGDILDTGVCHMAFFADPDGNALMLSPTIFIVKAGNEVLNGPIQRLAAPARWRHRAEARPRARR